MCGIEYYIEPCRLFQRKRLTQAEPGAREWAYRTPAREFELRRIEITAAEPYTGGPDHSAEILIVVALEGDRPVEVGSEGRTVELSRGGVLLVPHGVAYTIRAANTATLYKATVP